MAAGPVSRTAMRDSKKNSKKRTDKKTTDKKTTDKKEQINSRYKSEGIKTDLWEKM